MEANFITNNNQTAVNNTYDNKGAHDTIKFLMGRKENLILKFFPDRDGYLCCGVETSKIANFKYRIELVHFKWIWGYITKGNTEDMGINPEDVHPDKDAQIFAENMLKGLITKKHIFKAQVQVTPLFREVSSIVSATASFKKGKIIFRVPRTEALVSFLRENGYCA